MTDKFAAATKTFEDAVAAAKQNVDGLVKAQQEQIEKASAQLLKNFDELTALAKGNVDAVVKSGTIVAKGAEEAGKHVAAYTQSSLEKGAANGKALLAVKTIQELVELQSVFAKAAMETFVKESGKLQELSLKTAKEAFAPINDRVQVTVETLSKPVLSKAVAA
ncbi:phasin family protein [Azospirillum rugosum]|uniref:Phasin family protein n=1 Tax=Azospirillum rugosum TaxID=416170 RepID=A0ABS4SNC6_9PROT|nr:phasin family protein [Azospirillum rugosum]MBP2294063.1 phasin family protein [Azospirillum rugosum]MDQ0527548.1 phasin family protein [Azospirillum rugosum]